MRELGGRIRTTEIARARLEDGLIVTELTTGDHLCSECNIVQIGFLSARETFERLDIRLNDDGSIAIDPYYEARRQGVFAVGDVHGDIKRSPLHGRSYPCGDLGIQGNHQPLLAERAPLARLQAGADR